MEFLKHIIAFFTDREHPFSAKFVGATLFVVATLLLDNIFGISFYYSTKLKIEQLQAIKDLREDNDDPKLTALLNETEKQILERKNVIQIFTGLFTENKIDSIAKLAPDTVYITRHDTVYVDSSKQNTTLPEAKANELKDSRSQLWHTITSSYAFLILLIIFPIIPFTEDRFQWGLLIAMIFSMPFLAAVIWLNQFVFGLIPLILGKAWINYILNVILHALSLGLLGFMTGKSKKKS